MDGNPEPQTAPVEPGHPVHNVVAPEHRQVLLDRIGQMRKLLDTAHVSMGAGNTQSDIARRHLLHEVFGELQKQGVNLSDRSSVSTFISKLRVQNPVMAQNFEKSMDTLLGPAEGSAQNA